MIVLVIEVGERLVLFQEMVAVDFGETRIWHILKPGSLFFPVVNLVSKVFLNQFRIVDIFSVKYSPQYVNFGLSEFVIACKLSREANVDNSCQSSPWLVHMIYKHVGVPVQWTFVAKINKKDMVKALKHVEFLIMLMTT
ncbi:hypothetical protein Tco_1037840 [Tanacetum coccineum]